MTTRIGVIADTHCPEFLERIPERVFAALQGVEMLLHAGDITGGEALSELARIAPVEAVRGDHDRALTDLPFTRELHIEGRRVVIVHGNRSRLIEEPVTFVGTVSLGHLWRAPKLHEHLKRRFPDADVIVYGHTHAPAVRWLGGTLLFNPGAVYQVTRAEAERRLAAGPNWFEWTWLQVMRLRRRMLPASVGVLEFGPDGVEARVIPL